MSKKFAVISTDNNPDYYSLVPLACLSWSKLGYTPVVIAYGLTTVYWKYCPQAIIVDEVSISGVRNSTAAQVSRLYASNLGIFEDDDILITADADMAIMKDIFTHEADFVSYGYDLTGRSEIPICYIKATVKKWKEVFGTKIMMPPNAFSDDWNLYWGVDQQIATSTIQKSSIDKLLYVDRGSDQNNHGLPLGRWDRYKWENIPSEIIDVHMPRNPLTNWDKITDMAKRLWPEENFDWLQKFYNEIKNTTNG